MEQTDREQNGTGANEEELAATVPGSRETTILQNVALGSPQNGAFIKFIKQARFGSGILYVNVYDIYQNPVLKTKNVERVQWDDAAKERYLLKDGDLLFVRSSLKRDGVGQCCLIRNLGEPAIFDCHLIRVSPNTDVVEPLYLTYFFLAASQRRELIARSTTTTMTTLNQNGLMQMPVVLPPKAEQQAIVRAVRTVEESKEVRVSELTLERERKALLVDYLFTKGTRGEPTKQTEIGLAPVSWRLTPLRDLTSKITDGAHRTPTYVNTGIPFLRVVDIQAERIDWRRVKRIPEGEHANLIRRCKPERGDVLLSKNGTVGLTKVVDWDEEFSIFVSLCLIKTRRELVNSYFLAEYLASNGLPQIQKRGKKMTVTNLHLVEINELLIPTPPIEEQERIVEIIRASNRSIALKRKELTVLEELFDTMLETLTSGEFLESRI